MNSIDRDENSLVLRVCQQYESIGMYICVSSNPKQITNSAARSGFVVSHDIHGSMNYLFEPGMEYIVVLSMWQGHQKLWRKFTAAR